MGSSSPARTCKCSFNPSLPSYLISVPPSILISKESFEVGISTQATYISQILALFVLPHANFITWHNILLFPKFSTYVLINSSNLGVEPEPSIFFKVFFNFRFQQWAHERSKKVIKYTSRDDTKERSSWCLVKGFGKTIKGKLQNKTRKSDKVQKNTNCTTFKIEAHAP